MNHHFVASAMCDVTDEILWKPRMAWARKHNPTAALTFRVGSGKKTYLIHKRDISHDARMTLTYGKLMVASKANPDKLCKWLTSQEVHERRYFNGELTLLNVLSNCIAHEFAHFVQNILGWRYDGSVHNREFYKILDRIHANGEGNKIRAALHERCMQNAIDLRKVSPSQNALLALNGLLPNGEVALTMTELRRGMRLWFINPEYLDLGPVRVVQKLKGRVKVELVADTEKKWLAPPSAFKKMPA